MAEYPEALESDPDDVNTALAVGAAFWLRGNHADALKWLRKAVDAAFDEGADARGLELSKVAAALATMVPTTGATSLPAPMAPGSEPPSAPTPTAHPEAPPSASRNSEVPSGKTDSATTTGGGPALPLPRLTGRAARLSAPAPAPSSTTRTAQGVGAPMAPLLTPFARVTPLGATPPGAVKAHGTGDPTSGAPEPSSPSTMAPSSKRTEAPNQASSQRAPDDPTIESLVHSAFPNPIEPAPPARQRTPTRLWNATDAIRVAVSREGDRCVVRVCDGSDLREDEIDAVMIGLDGGPGLADLLQVFGSSENLPPRKD